MSEASRRAALARGAAAEGVVAGHLVSEGWTVLARNWRGGGGELDLVVRRGDALRFVEVKARESGDASGWDAVDGVKQGRLIGAAEAWLAAQDAPLGEVCFLLAVVELHGDAVRIEWVDDPFDGPVA